MALPENFDNCPISFRGVFERKFLTFLTPSSVLIIIPLTISTDLLIFFNVGSNSVLTIVVVDVKSYYEEEDPGQDPGQDPEDPEDPPIQDDVENIKVVRSLFITETGELFAPEATSLVVYDVNGRVVASASSSQLCVASLSRGIYLVRSVYSDASVQVTKIVK